MHILLLGNLQVSYFTCC